MTLKAPRNLITVAALAALAGCQSGPHWAFWKHDSAPDSAAVARSAAQSTPQPVAIAGLTSAAPPSSANLAAAKVPGANSLAAGTPALPPSMSIPVTSSTTLANAPQAVYPNAANTLADRLTSAPSATTRASTTALPPSALPPLPPTSPLAAASPPPAAGPYDPKGYKPGAALASSGMDGSGDSSDADRYGMGSASHYSASPPANLPQSPATLPSNRYSAVPGATSPAATAPAPAFATAPAPSNQMPAQSPAPVSDRYGMSSTLPSSASMNPTTPVSPATIAPTANAPYVSTMAVTPTATPVANPTPAVRTTAAVGGYRPGGTSSYTAGAQVAPLEVATRPAPPTSTLPATAPVPAIGGGSEPWTPPAPSTMPTGTRTY